MALLLIPRCNVFITGCNRGLGLEFVKQFLRLKNPPEHLFATCRSLAAESAAELKTLASENSNLHVLELEVTDFEAVELCAKKVEDVLKGKGLNVLMNNAGIVERSTIDNVTPEEMMHLYKTNTVAPLMITKALLPSLKEAAKKSYEQDTKFPKALILNMSSKVGSVDDNKSGKKYSYRASKAALNIINKSLSVDLKGDGVTAVLLHPGYVQTDMGGPSALTSTEESVSGMMAVIAGLDETKNGMWFDFRGSEIPW